MALAVYTLLVAIAALRNADQINPDGVAYIRLAQCIARGQFSDSVSSHWSPLLSWCLVPFMALGLDGLWAARLVLALWGGLFVLGAGLLMLRFTAMPPVWGLLALVLVALLAAHRAVAGITPDIMIAACLMMYFSEVANPDFADSNRRPLTAGLLGGVAFLAKAYALPFFLVHLPFSIGIAYWLRSRHRRVPSSHGGRLPLRRAVASLLVGLGSFAAVTLPWICLLSVRSGHATFTSAGAYNRALARPSVRPQSHVMLQGLWPPEAGRITVWETPETLPCEDWSPTASMGNLVHQIKIVGENLQRVQAAIAGYDVLCLMIGVCGIAPVLAYGFWRRMSEDAYRIMWYAGTFSLYCGGLLLIYAESRYIIPVLFPVGCLICVHLAWRANQHLRNREGAKGRVVAALLLGTVAVSFGAPRVASIANDIISPEAQPYRMVGHRLQALGCTGPIASSDWWSGLYVAYHANQPFLGTPAEKDWKGCERELDDYQAETFLVWEGSPMGEPYGDASHWVLAEVIDDCSSPTGQMVKVYVRQAARKTGAGGER